MHDAEIVVELYALARESHVRISEHVAAVLVLEQPHHPVESSTPAPMRQPNARQARNALSIPRRTMSSIGIGFPIICREWVHEPPIAA